MSIDISMLSTKGGRLAVICGYTPEEFLHQVKEFVAANTASFFLAVSRPSRARFIYPTWEGQSIFLPQTDKEFYDLLSRLPD